MNPRVTFFLVSLLTFFLVVRYAEASTVFQLTWSPVTLDTEGKPIPANDIEYVLYGRDDNMDTFQMFAVLKETTWLGPAMRPGCYYMYVTARRIASRLESVPSNEVTACVYPDGGEQIADDGETVLVPEPDVDSHSPPSPPDITVETLQVEW